MPQPIQELLQQYVNALREMYASHVRRIILYGSYARGDFSADSDIDIMILVDISDIEIKEYFDRLVEITYDFNMEHDLDIKPIAKNEAQFKKWETEYPFYANVSREGVVLYAAA